MSRSGSGFKSVADASYECDSPGASADSAPMYGFLPIFTPTRWVRRNTAHIDCTAAALTERPRLQTSLDPGRALIRLNESCTARGGRGDRDMGVFEPPRTHPWGLRARRPPSSPV